MEPRISMVVLGVSDLERSVRFYRDGLGLPRRESAPEIAFFTTRGTWLSLYERKALAEDAGVSADGRGFAGVTLAHNVRSREEVDRVIATALAAGARVTSPAQERFWGGYSGYFADPDGFLWEVAWNPHFVIE
jgi:catechol 2,3-dioxygenase-like lactoylglutathione lyase family enzyme